MTLCALIDLVANGDVAGTAKPGIIFKTSAHKQFYNEMLSKCTYKDCYHCALMYALGINEDARRHIDEIYDFNTRYIKPDVLKKSWITGSSARAIRLAFNLFTDNIPEDKHKEYSTTATSNIIVKL